MKIDEYVSPELLKKYGIKLSVKQKHGIANAIKDRKAILFVGDLKTGKTALAKELQKKGIAAYAPEGIRVIKLGVELPYATEANLLDELFAGYINKAG